MIQSNNLLDDWETLRIHRVYVHTRSSLSLPLNVLTCRLMGRGMPDQVKATFDEDVP